MYYTIQWCQLNMMQAESRDLEKVEVEMKAEDEAWVWLKEGRWTERHLDWLMPESGSMVGGRVSGWGQGWDTDRQRTTEAC